MRTLALTLALCGCSIAGTRSVAHVGASRCTTSVAPAALDTLIVAGAIAFATYASLEMQDTDQIAIPAASGVFVVYGISAGVGYYRATTCKRARIREGIAF